MLWPFPTDPPFSTYAEAVAFLADQSADCYGVYNVVSPGTLPSVFTVSIDSATQVTLEQTIDAPVAMMISVTVPEACTLTADYIGNGSADFAAAFNIYTCDTIDTVYTDTAATATGTLGASSSLTAGTYLLDFGYSSDASPINVVFTLTSSADIVVNPVIAQWDDSGTTRWLEACPKLLLPQVTESSGNWYVDATEAATVITDQTNGCKGFINSMTNVASFTASGTTTLTLAETLTSAAMTCPAVWGSVNIASGETITSTVTVGAGTAGQTVDIYDYAGNLVDSSGGPTTSPWTSSAVPFPGRYTVTVSMSSGSNTTSMSAAISSSGTMSINPPQALYDVGLTCPARDDC
jgi:hypothetical protein